LKVDKKAMLLYVVTDRTWLGDDSLADQVEETIKAGATFVQLREKNLAFDEFVSEAKQLKKLTDKYGIPFVVNDNIEVAIAADADGVHVGQSDMNAKDVRAMIGNDKILGVSAVNVEQALLAEKSGADYIGVGAVFITSTKNDADYVSYDTLKEICKAVSVPVVAIGGISSENILQLKGSEIDGVAVISAIFGKPDIYKATEELRGLAEQVVGGDINEKSVNDCRIGLQRRSWHTSGY
jgi:thiamine-phosphate pyrophosphorylase